MANKITYEDKVAINPAGTAINQVQDVDLNEIKEKHNLNDDRTTQNESDINTNATSITAANSAMQDNTLLLQKENMSEGVIQDIFVTSANTLWNINDTYDERSRCVWYEMISDGVVSGLKIPLPKNRADVDIIGSITVRIAVNSAFYYTKVLSNAELIEWGINTLDRDPDDSMYLIDIPILQINSGDEVYISWSCNNASDTLTFQYDSSDATETFYANLYNLDSASDLSELTEVPTPLSEYPGWQFPAQCVFIDYVQQKINEGSNKSALDIVQPSKIYAVCNDIDKSDSGFDSNNNAVSLYVDHMIKLSAKKDIYISDTESDNKKFYAPVSDYGDVWNEGVDILTTNETITLKGDYADKDVSIDVVSTLNSATSSEFPKVLFIGDSVTDKFLSDKPTSETENNPTAYWSYVKKFFYEDKLLNGGTGFDFLSLGVKSSREFIVDGNTVKAYAEGNGGWTTRDYLYEKDFSTDVNRFYDSSKSGTVKFSLAKYLDRYKTLNDDGITRLTVGVDAGSEVTDVDDYDVCTPDIVYIQLGFNDDEGNWSGDIDLMIAEIQSEYPSMKIIISTIDSAGTYFPEKYPEISGVDMLGDGLHSKMYNLADAAKAKEDTVNGVYYCPNYYIQPTAWAYAFREVNDPAFDTNSRFPHKVSLGAGNEYHPNTYAHANWGYQVYSLIKYITQQ